MKKIAHLEAPIHERNCSVHAGTVSYTEPDGEQVEAEFYVRTCGEDETIEHTGPQTRGDREDDLNEQTEDLLSDLMQQGCTDIHMQDISPNPFF